MTAKYVAGLTLAVAVAAACGFDNSLREYLYARFWQPFPKSVAGFSRPIPPRPDPFAGMGPAEASTPLGRLRLAYRTIAAETFTQESLAAALAEARAAAPPLSPRDREEIDLIDAKIQLPLAEPDNTDGLQLAAEKLRAFLRNARDPLWLSEARGWLAHIHYKLGNWSAAGKIYLDELKRRDTNLSRDTLLASLHLMYGYDGSRTLLPFLEEYFDTPEHAAFAITLVTNPGWDRRTFEDTADRSNAPYPQSEAPPWERVNATLQNHRSLFATEHGADLLTELGMRIALRAASPQGALKIAAGTPASASVRRSPDFLWMLGAARFLTRRYREAEAPLLALFASDRADPSYRMAAAYGLCGVYSKTGNYVEQIRMALWLRDKKPGSPWEEPAGPSIGDMSIYWAMSGFDLGALLDYEAPEEAIRAFLDQYPSARGVRLVRYALAVRLARAERYAESAGIYSSVNAPSRAARMRRLAELKAEAEAAVSGTPAHQEATLRLAGFLAANSTGVYYNDRLWNSLQRYALVAEQDSRLTAKERRHLVSAERRLRDEQEEYWRAYQMLRDVVREAGTTATGREAAQLALRCLRRINTERFGRENEIRAADIELSRWLRRSG